MKALPLEKLLDIAKRKSPFYRSLYKDIKISGVHLADLPIINEDLFWKANSHKNNQVLTEPAHGLLLRSGGSMGNPKTSVFSANEWRLFAQILTSKLHKADLLQDNDRVANMFASGTLYGGFLFIHETLLQDSTCVLELPIGMGRESRIEDAVSLMKEFQVNVLMSPPYTMVSLVSYIKSNKIKNLNIDRFLYGSDLLLESQYQFIKSVFPNAIITSSGYASTDGGFLGYADSTCKINEYRTDSHFTIAEIVDEKTGQIIEKENIRGRLLITNLTKTLMPVIRYPVGDLAIWCEPKKQKFRKLALVGRDTKKDDLLIIGGKSYDYQDFYTILKKSKFHPDILGFQIFESNKRIAIKIACHDKKRKIFETAKREVYDLFTSSIAGIKERSLEIEFVDIFELAFFPRTYKAIKIIKD